MRAIRVCCCFGLVAFLLSPGGTAAPTQEGGNGGVDVKVVKYDGLAETVRQLRGKVVLVDFWSTNCIPCMKAFPHVMEVQRRYGGDGLAVVTVALKFDPDSSLAEERARVLKFLQTQNATCTNVLLDEKDEVWQARFRFDQIPAAFVFDRAGKWYEFKDEFSYDDVENRVAELVKAR